MKIHLAIAFDQNYLHPFYALLSSILKHHREVHIHSIATGVDESTIQRITECVLAGGSLITFYAIEDRGVTEFVTMSTWTTAVYYRLYFPLLIDDSIERILYLDSDMIVLKNLQELYSAPLNNHPVGAVYDNYVKVQPLIGLTSAGEYFNSGLLLVDVAEWRRLRISQKTMDYLLQYPERIKYVDQCGLNAILCNNWMRLDKGFNLLYTYIPDDATRTERKKILRESTIIHFTLQRPWRMLCKNRFRSLYRVNLLSSGLFRGLSSIEDFSIKDIPAWLHIRLLEFYHDAVWLKKSWRTIKRFVA